VGAMGEVAGVDPTDPRQPAEEGDAGRGPVAVTTIVASALPRRCRRPASLCDTVVEYSPFGWLSIGSRTSSNEPCVPRDSAGSIGELQFIFHPVWILRIRIPRRLLQDSYLAPPVFNSSTP